jgi:hypothetical protein
MLPDSATVGRVIARVYLKFSALNNFFLHIGLFNDFQPRWTIQRWLSLVFVLRSELGRAVAQAVSRRPLTAEALVRSRVSPCGICGGQSGTGTGFSPRTSVFACQFHSTGAPLLGKTKKTNHLHHRVAQYALRLRCVRSICCGALHHKKYVVNFKKVAPFTCMLTVSTVSWDMTFCVTQCSGEDRCFIFHLWCTYNGWVILIMSSVAS